MTNILSCLIILLLTNCKSSEQQSVDPPSCINSKIESIKKEPSRNPPAEIWKWETNGNIYYYFNAPCCDQYNYLLNEACERVCAPDGGFTGKGDGKCPDFGTDIKKTLVWKDARSTK